MEWKNTFFLYIRSRYWQDHAWKMNRSCLRTPSTLSKCTENKSSCWRECGGNDLLTRHIYSLHVEKINLLVRYLFTYILHIQDQMFRKVGELQKYSLKCIFFVTESSWEVMALKQIGWKKWKINKWLEAEEDREKVTV